MSSGPSIERPHSEADWRRCLGRRVSLRYRLGTPSESPFSEAYGVLASVDRTDAGPALSIFTKKGENKVVPIADIEVAKVLP
jgi:hypothetical protein